MSSGVKVTIGFIVLLSLPFINVLLFSNGGELNMALIMVASCIPGFMIISNGFSSSIKEGQENHKECKYCKSDIPKDALTCRDCGKDVVQGIEKSSSDDNSKLKDDTSEELKKYKKMLDDGLIEQDDYDAKKKELLNL